MPRSLRKGPFVDLHLIKKVEQLQGPAGIEEPEPVAWTHQRPNGGRVFYTSLGSKDDFNVPDFQLLLRNAVYWAASLPVPATADNKAVPDGC